MVTGVVRPIPYRWRRRDFFLDRRWRDGAVSKSNVRVTQRRRSSKIETSMLSASSRKHEVKRVSTKVRERGLEPPRDYLPLGPQPSASASSATRAILFYEGNRCRLAAMSR